MRDGLGTTKFSEIRRGIYKFLSKVLRHYIIVIIFVSFEIFLAQVTGGEMCSQIFFDDE